VDIETLHTRREASRRAVRRRRGVAGVIALVVVVVAIVAVASGLGGASPVARHGTRSDAPSALIGSQSRLSHHGHSAGGAGLGKGPPGNQPVPILMYHVISTPPPGAPFPGLYVAPSEFAAQMQALRSAGWHAVTLDQLEAYWSRGEPLGEGKPIVLSFDNGYQSQYTQALPVLRRLGWVGDENLQLTGLPPSQGGLGEEQIRGLLAAGWELDTQGFSHADLTTLDAQELHYQVAGARAVLRQRYHVPVNWFCYPSGDYDATVIAAVKAAGYTGSTTVVPGWVHPGDDPYRLHRLRVLGGTTPAELLNLIANIRQDPPAPPSYTA
jgi:peptidoglycan/xylan/chitin deacetylase (PgdA/CDA1 family)